MAIDRRKRAAPRPICKGNVGMAYGDRVQRDLDLACLRVAQLHILNAERVAKRMADRCFYCFHGPSQTVCPCVSLPANGLWVQDGKRSGSSERAGRART